MRTSDSLFESHCSLYCDSWISRVKTKKYLLQRECALPILYLKVIVPWSEGSGFNMLQKKKEGYVLIGFKQPLL